MLLVAANADPRAGWGYFQSNFSLGFLAELIGIPVAWLRLRKLEAWKERPEDTGPIGLLSLYVTKVTVLLLVWAVLVSLSAFAGSKV